MKISTREMWLILTTYISILLFFIIIYINKKNEAYKINEIEINSLNSKIISNNKFINMNKMFEDELMILEKNIMKFDKNEKSVSPKLMQEIKKIASKNGVSITRNQPFDEKPIGDLFEIGINCTWNSNLKSLISFLAELQKNNQRYKVKTINIMPDAKDSQLKGNMIIECAYMKK